MNARIKIGRNDQCPCMSGKKYKYCCLGKVDWNRIFSDNPEEYINNISVRGRNIIFLERVYEALQFDKEPVSITLSRYKDAFTTDAVRKIHEAILETWPTYLNINSVLETHNTEVSGLYVGQYLPIPLLRGVTRHSLYANKMLLIDPFPYPFSMRDEYNPVIHPEKYRTQTLKNVNIWIGLSDWIKEGIVEFIRPPTDFDSELLWESVERQKKKFDDNKELQALLKQSAIDMEQELKNREDFTAFYLSGSDEFLRHKYQSIKMEANDMSEEEFIRLIYQLREQNPYYLEPLPGSLGQSEILVDSCGASYDIAKYIASITGSYLVTDLKIRWREIELDREESSVVMNEWSPLAKAFQNLKWKCLNNLDINHALRLRKEGRLESLRAFLYRLWTSVCSDEPYSQVNAVHLADELRAKVAEAEEEWKQIDRELIRWFGGEAVAALLAGGPLIASGHAGFLAGATIAAGSANLIYSSLKRKGFANKFPAAFFMNLSND